jgi:hypothetical protein
VPTITIPCPLCDTFPFDEPTELAQHLESECAGRFATPAPTPAPAPVPTPLPAPAATVPTLAPGGTRATARRPAKPCTGSQASFIRTLVARKGADLPDLDTLTIRDASALIDTLLDSPDAPSAPAARATSGITPEHGRVYATADGVFVKVTESKAGNLYGKLLDADGKFTVYERGLLSRIARKLTAEEAARFGHEHHRCVFCARTLTDEQDGRSVDVGYGPICADKYGLPWG